MSDPYCGRGHDRRSRPNLVVAHATVLPLTASPMRVELVRAAKSAARSPRSVSRGADCSWNEPRARPAASASLAMSTGLAAAQGEHLARSPVPPTVPPWEVTAEITHLFEYPRTGIILRCGAYWLLTRNRCTGLRSSKRDFLSFPAAAKEDMGNALGIAQFGGTAPTAKPWKGLGPGVLEVVESHDGNAYRAVYTVRFEKAVYVLHAFQKKSPSGIRTAKRDVDLVAERLKTAERDYEEHHGKQKR